MVAQKVVQSAARQLQNAPGGSASVDAAYISSLAPAQGGSGLVVGEPVPAASLKGQSAWGAGASRWLQVQVGGLPELGQTPLWGVIENGRRQLQLPNLQVSGASATDLGRACGVTHVATGTLGGTPADATLAYQLIDVASGKTAGTAQIGGSLKELHAQLPALAKTLATTLKVKAGTSTAIALSPDDLAFLGAPPLKPGFRAALTAPQQARLKNLVAKDVLAGIMAQRWCEYPNPTAWQNVADGMTKMAPRNALVWAEIAYTGPIRVVTLKPQLAALQAKFPGNYLLCQAGVAFERGNRARPLQVQWAEKAARAAPQSSYAWVDLSGALFDQAHALRRGRYSNQISGAEWAQLNAIYPKSQAAALQATRVNAGDSHAWDELAQSAIFNGDQNTANAALEKAITLDPTNGHAWSWGLEMTHPKWSGDAQRYAAFAARAANHADSFAYPAEDVSSAFFRLKKRPELKPVLETVVQKDPRNVEALTELGGVYHYDDRSYAKAEKLYRQALAIEPNHARALSSLGDLTYWVHNDPAGAFALYRGAILAEPKVGAHHANLGRMLALTGRKSAGAAEANIAKQLGFDDATHPVWQATGVSPP